MVPVTDAGGWRGKGEGFTMTVAVKGGMQQCLWCMHWSAIDQTQEVPKLPPSRGVPGVHWASLHSKGRGETFHSGG